MLTIDSICETIFKSHNCSYTVVSTSSYWILYPEFLGSQSLYKAGIQKELTLKGLSWFHQNLELFLYIDTKVIAIFRFSIKYINRNLVDFNQEEILHIMQARLYIYNW